MITNKDVRVENGNLVLNGDKYPLDGQSPEAIMEIVEDNSDSTPTAESTAPVTSAGIKAYVDTAVGGKVSAYNMANYADMDAALLACFNAIPAETPCMISFFQGGKWAGYMYRYIDTYAIATITKYDGKTYTYKTDNSGTSWTGTNLAN